VVTGISAGDALLCLPGNSAKRRLFHPFLQFNLRTALHDLRGRNHAQFENEWEESCWLKTNGRRAAGTAHDCRWHAKTCRKEAEKCVSILEREGWLMMAEEWSKLAKEFEQHQGVASHEICGCRLSHCWVALA
jgi:hypothetical protein